MSERREAGIRRAESGPNGPARSRQEWGTVSDYLPILVMSAVVIAFVMLSFIASQLLAPSRPNSAKQAPYECGIVPKATPPSAFR